MNSIFAGSVFSPDEWSVLLAAGLIVTVVCVSVLVWVLMKIASKVGLAHPVTSYRKLFFIVTTVLTAAILLFVVAPTIIDDQQYLAKQKECGQKVGLDYRLINSNQATAEQQQTFFTCLSE